MERVGRLFSRWRVVKHVGDVDVDVDVVKLWSSEAMKLLAIAKTTETVAMTMAMAIEP
jgi:hypothetical protein